VKSEAKINKVIIGTTGDGNIRSGYRCGEFCRPSFPTWEVTSGRRTTRRSALSAATPFQRIGSVVIKGNVFSTPQFGDHFGIVAGQIDGVKIAGVALKLTPNLDVIEVTPATPPVGAGETPDDFTVREVSFSSSPSGSV
jgi:hypothetical protein